MAVQIFEWHEKLTFGKFIGRHLDEAFQEDPQYIQKCLEEMEDFHITVYTKYFLEEMIDGFKFSDKALKNVVNQKKYSSKPGESEFKLYPSGDPFIQPLDDII